MCLPFLVLLVLCSFSGALHAQSNDARLDRIENEIQTLSRAVFKGEQPPAGSLSSLNNNPAAVNTIEQRLSDLENDVRDLTGRLEEMQYEMNQFMQKTDAALAASMSGANGTTLTTPGSNETFAGGLPGQRSYEPVPGNDQSAIINVDNDLPMPSATNEATNNGSSRIDAGTLNADELNGNANDLPVDTNTINPSTSSGTLGTLGVNQGGDYTTTPEGAAEAYEQAFSLIKEENYDLAEQKFQAFLDNHPNSELAGNAMYWLGETYYVRGEHEDAARTFAMAYQQYPNGTKGPDNLLKLAMSLAAIGSTDDACLTLAQLKTEYPAGSGAVLSRADQERTRLNCAGN